VGWLVMTVHLGTLLSVYLRHGAMLIAVAICYFVAPFLLTMTFAVLSMLLFRGGSGGGSGGVTEALMRYLLPLGVIVAEAFGCVIIHRLIFHRVEELAGR
ncbi:MAG: hypothetical protein WCO86_02575, partial [Planctomycetota bacterium]